MNIKIKMTREENIAQFGMEPVELPLEEYLCGVVPAEVYESSAMDALKAQAVAARTFALKRAFDATVIDDTTAFQAHRRTWKRKIDRRKGMVFLTESIPLQSFLSQPVFANGHGFLPADRFRPWSGAWFSKK